MAQDSESSEPEREFRMSDAERDDVVERLRVASSEGRITLEEFSERSRQAYAAEFPSDVEGLLADLPPGSADLPVRAGSAPVATAGAAGGAGAVAKPAGAKRRWFFQMMGGATRNGNWDAARPVTAITVMGGQTIDLTEVDAAEVEITAVTLMGGSEVIVPHGAQVDVGGFMLFGGIGNETGPASGSDTMRVRIRAVGGMGAFEVRHLSDDEIAQRRA